MTPATKTVDSVVVKIRARTEMESMIESAVYKLQPRARELKQGMLVNRITCEVFIISLTDNAAYGTIYEEDELASGEKYHRITRSLNLSRLREADLPLLAWRDSNGS